MNKYGKNGGCVCCEEKEMSFLTIDHIKDNGSDHRGEKGKPGGGNHLYRFITRSGFPEGFQVLCFNCQWGKQINKGFCPHHPKTDLRKGPNES